MDSKTARPLPIQGEPLASASVPLGFFAMAVLWFALGGLGIAITAGDLAVGNVLAPRVIAITHAFTLGMLTQAIFGALHQFLPAVVGTPLRHPRVARASLVIFPIGLVMLVVGLWAWLPGWQAIGWTVLFAGVGAASWNTLPARRRATRNRYIGGFVSLSHSALGFAMGVAAIRIGDGLGWWHADRLSLLAIHFHLGALGFGSLTAVAFGSKMLPAFLGSGVQLDRRVPAIAWLASVGLTVFSIGLLGGWGPITLVGEATMALATLGHLWLLIDYFRLRQPGRIDPGLALAAIGAGGYLAALITGVALAVGRGTPGRIWALYAFLAVVGWLSMLILGVMHRVAPRIVVLWLVEHRRSLSPAAQRAELLHGRLGWATVGAVAIGVVATAVGLGFGATALIRVGGGFLAGAAGLVGLQGVRLWRAARTVGMRPPTY